MLRWAFHQITAATAIPLPLKIHLYIPPCPSIGQLVGRSVGRSHKRFMIYPTHLMVFWSLLKREMDKYFYHTTSYLRMRSFRIRRYREYHANRDKRKRHIFSSENEKSDLKTDSDRSFKPILYHQEKLSLYSTLKVHKGIEKKAKFDKFHVISFKNLWSTLIVHLNG